jgi:hypothetical protein
MPSQSGRRRQPGAANSDDLEQVRSNALQTVVDYRRIVISLEIKRIADSRVSSMMWEERCRIFYQPEDYLVIRACPLIENARHQIHSVFSRAAATNQVLFDRMITHINGARSVGRISALLLLMERNLTLNSGIRQRYAVAIMQHLRRDLQRIFGSLIEAQDISRIDGDYDFGDDNERWHRTVFRMTLGLTFDGRYHPNPIPIRINIEMPMFTYQAEYYFAITHTEDRMGWPLNQARQDWLLNSYPVDGWLTGRDPIVSWVSTLDPRAPGRWWDRE